MKWTSFSYCFHLATITIATVACSERSNFSTEGESQTRVAQMTFEQRKALVPNELFAAVWDHSLQDVDRLAKERPDLMSGEDDDKNTPLGVAIRLGYQDISLRLVSELPRLKLTHQNKHGESYVFLASASGQPRIIEALGDRWYRSLGGLQRYHFDHIDLEDKHGRRGLFVAADRIVAQALETEYYRGSFVGTPRFPAWYFWLAEDKYGQSFLHRAAETGRTDVINWAKERICAPSSWETSTRSLFGVPWISYAAKAKNYVVRGFQTYVGDVQMPFDLLFNRQDSNGDSALHLALRYRQLSAATALGGCRWIDFDSINRHNEIPLQTFLKSLNPTRPNLSKAEHAMLLYLVERPTRLRRWFFSKSDRVDWPHPHGEGDSSLHIAAQLADPYFYEVLSKIGDIQAKNRQQMTPAFIFENKRNLVRTNRL